MHLGNHEEEYVRRCVQEAGREAADRFHNVVAGSLQAFKKAHDEVHRAQEIEADEHGITCYKPGAEALVEFWIRYAHGDEPPPDAEFDPPGEREYIQAAEEQAKEQALRELEASPLDPNGDLRIMKLSRSVAVFKDYLMDHVAVLLACITAQGRRLTATIAADVLHRARATVWDRLFALECRGLATSSHKGIRRYFSATDELMQLWESSGCPTYGDDRGCQVCGNSTEYTAHHCMICGSDFHWKPRLQKQQPTTTSEAGRNSGTDAGID